MIGNPAKRSAGVSYLEVQVAMVMLAIGVTGLYSMSVVHTKQTARLAELLDEDVTHAFNPAGQTWEQKLGVFAEIEDELRVRPAVEPRIVTEMVNDSHAGAPDVTMSDRIWYDLYPDWQPYSTSQAYSGSAHYSYVWMTDAWLEATFEGLPADRYEVFTTYPVYSFSGKAVPHVICDDATVLGEIRVDQSLHPVDLSFDGKQWRRLGVFRCDSGRLRVQLINRLINGSYAIADAFLVRNAATMRVLSVTETTAGGFTAVLEDVP
jgi:hypothetical protein